MSQRVIACQVVGEYVTGDGVVIGAAGSHDEVIIELDFSKAGETWDGTTKTVTFTDALGLNPTNVLLTAAMLVTGTTNVYLVPVPNLIKAISGQMGMTVAGVDVEGTTEVLRVATELSRFRILPNEMVTWEGDDDVSASAAEQLQAQIDAVLPKFVQLDDSVAAAAASAAASAGSATASAGSAEDAEAWAVGQRGGVDVESTDETYQNNSKYYAGQAAGSASASGASAAAAAGSASASAASASDSAGSASAAAGSATAAEGSADSAEDWAAASAGSASAAAASKDLASASEANAANSAASAASSASAAAGSATAAGTSASNAAGSASASAGSATASAGSAANAAGSAVLSESWAVGHTGARPGEDTNNAKYWSEQAQAAAGGGVSSFNGRSGVVIPQSGDYTARMVGALPEDTPIPSKTSDLTNDSGFITVEQVPAVPVQSVNSKTGNVVLDYSDVGADQAGAAGTVQGNLTNHIGDNTKHITAAERAAWNAKQDALTFDNTPTQNSANPVKSGGVFSALSTLGAQIADKASVEDIGSLWVWERFNYTPQSYSLDTSISNQVLSDNTSGSRGVDITVQYSSNIEVAKDGTVRLSGTISTLAITNSNPDAATTSLRGKYCKYSTNITGTIPSEVKNSVFFLPNNATIIYEYYRLSSSGQYYYRLKASLIQFVTGTAETKVHDSFLCSIDGTTYPTDGQSGGYLYTRLGQIGESFDGAKIETGSYIGTGTYGSSNPNSLTFGLDPMVVFLSPIEPNSNASCITVLKGNATGLDAYANSYIILSWGIKTMSWYNTTNALKQFNGTDVKYIYVAIG